MPGKSHARQAKGNFVETRVKHCTQCVISVPILVLLRNIVKILHKTGTLVSLGVPRFTRVSTQNRLA